MTNSLKLYIFFSSVFCTVIVTGNLIFQKFVVIKILSLQLELSVGVLLYPITFLISDLVTEFYGNKYANYMTIISVLCSMIVICLIMIGNYLPATSWSKINNDDFHQMFSVYNIAAITSIIASFCGQLIDIQIYLYLKNLTNSKYLWFRNNVSTIIAQGLDTILVITMLSCAKIIAWENYYIIAINSLIFKIVAALLDTPFCYLGYYLIRKYLR